MRHYYRDIKQNCRPVKTNIIFFVKDKDEKNIEEIFTPSAEQLKNKGSRCLESYLLSTVRGVCTNLSLFSTLDKEGVHSAHRCTKSFKFCLVDFYTCIP